MKTNYCIKISGTTFGLTGKGSQVIHTGGCEALHESLMDACQINSIIWDFQPSKDRAGYVYILRTYISGSKGLYKIGRTSKPEARIRALLTQLPTQSELATIIPCIDAVAAEKTLHKWFESSRRNGEWFDLTDEQLESLLCIEAM